MWKSISTPGSLTNPPKLDLKSCQMVSKCLSKSGAAKPTSLHAQDQIVRIFSACCALFLVGWALLRAYKPCKNRAGPNQEGWGVEEYRNISEVLADERDEALHALGMVWKEKIQAERKLTSVQVCKFPLLRGSCPMLTRNLEGRL